MAFILNKEIKKEISCVMLGLRRNGLEPSQAFGKLIIIQQLHRNGTRKLATPMTLSESKRFLFSGFLEFSENDFESQMDTKIDF